MAKIKTTRKTERQKKRCQNGHKEQKKKKELRNKEKKMKKQKQNS